MAEYGLLATQLRQWADVDPENSLPAIAMREAAAALDDLERWKAEALVVLGAWHEVWKAAGCPVTLGSSIAEATAAYVTTLRAELAEFKQWASDACELLHTLRACNLSLSLTSDIDELLVRMENP